MQGGAVTVVTINCTTQAQSAERTQDDNTTDRNFNH